jgi:hypothetical protein
MEDSMPAQPLTFALSDDKTLLLVSPASGEPFAMNALVTEELVHVLIAARADMNPKRVPSDPFAGTQMLSHPEMRWYASPGSPGAGMMQLCLGHPGLGWMGLVLDRDGLELLMTQMKKALAKERQRRPRSSKRK